MTGSRQPTLAHVALAAGVSTSTASACLRDRPGPSQATKDHVRQVARDMGYRVRVGASSLRTGMRPTAALILDPITMDRMAYVESYYAIFLNALVRDASAENLPVTIVSSADAEVLNGTQVDAVLFMNQESIVDHLSTVGFGLPLLAISMGNNDIDLDDPRLTTVLRHDHAGICRAALDHLQSEGTQHPALIYGRERSRLHVNEDCFRDWARGVGVESRVFDVDTSRARADVVDELIGILASDIDAIYTVLLDPSLIAEASQRVNRVIPDDVLLVSQTEQPYVPLWDVELSTVSFHPEDSARIAVRAIKSAIAGQSPRIVDMRESFYPGTSSTRPIKRP